MASHGFVLEASSLVSIYISLVLSIHSKKSHFMLPTDISRYHVYPALLLQSAGVCGFRPFWVSRPSNRGLETCEMVQPTIGPADPGGDAAASHQQANPTTSPTDRLLPRAVCRDNRSSGPICLQHAMLARRSPKRPLARKRAKLNWRPPHRSGAVVVDPRASIWKIHLRLAGLSGRSGPINLTPPTTVARNTKTRSRTLMTPLNPLTGLSQVLTHLPWPPAPPVPLPRRPSDRCGVFHSATPCLDT